MLQNAYLLAKIGADTAENELTFAEILLIGVLDSAAPRALRPERGAFFAARRGGGAAEGPRGRHPHAGVFLWVREGQN